MAERILAMMMAPLFTHIWFILHLIKFPFFQQNTTDLSSLFLLLLKKNINSVSSQCLRYDWTRFLLVSAASREPCILLCTCTVGKIHYCVKPRVHVAAVPVSFT